jgi:lipid-A-disaccharide synthase
LVAEIQRQSHGIPIVFEGMGGDAMRSAGVDVRWDVTAMSTIGFVEPIKYLPRFVQTYRQIKSYLARTRPDLIIPVDFQGFNMVLCKAARSLGIPVVYYIGPQFWQWGRVSDAKAYIPLTRLLLTIFEEETAYYRTIGADPIYIGHPILDLLPEKRVSHRLQDEILHIGVFPGSRRQELVHSAPILMATAQRLQVNHSDKRVSVTVSVAHPRYALRLRKMAADLGLQNCRFVSGVPRELLETCDIALSTSGTMTLELALSGVPLVSVYRLHPLSYRVAKWVLWKKFQAMGYFSLPNLMLKKMVVPEYLQDNATVATVTAAAENLLTNSDARATIQADYAKLRECLGSGGATQRAASEISRFLQISNKG